MKKKLFVIPLILLIITGVAYGGWYVYRVSIASTNEKIEGSGTIEADELNIGSQVAAEVLELKFKEGDKVKRGDTLIVLDNRVLKDQVAVAQAGVDVANAAVDAADTDAKKKAAEAQVDQAKASLAIAQIQQGYAVITSPVDGTVISLPLSVGEMANPGSTLAVIGKSSELNLTIYVGEKELGRVRVGQKAKVKVDAYSDKEFVGKITEIASEAEFTPQNVQTKEQRSNLVFGVTIRVDDPKGLLKPGMPADATLE